MNMKGNRIYCVIYGKKALGLLNEFMNICTFNKLETR